MNGAIDRKVSINSRLVLDDFCDLSDEINNEELPQYSCHFSRGDMLGAYFNRSNNSTTTLLI